MSDRRALRVLLLADYSDVGGTRTYIKQLIALYASRDVQLIMATTYRANDPEMQALCAAHGFELSIIDDVAVGGVQRGRLPGRVWREEQSLREFVSARMIDLVVASVGEPELFLGIFGLGVPALYILHTYPEPPKDLSRAVFKRACLSLLIRNNARLVTVSGFSMRRIRRIWGVPGASVGVVHSTAGPVIDPVPDRVDSGRVVVLTIGHVEDYKAPMDWIGIAHNAIDRSPARSFEFIWVGPGAMLEMCRNRVKALGIGDSVRFVGAESDVDRYYRDCDVYLQPSRVESLGLSVLDAMRRSIPCIVSDAGGLPELVIEGESGWILPRPLSAATAVDRLAALASREDVRRAMGVRGRAHYEKMFSEERWRSAIWQEHVDVLRSNT